MESVVLVLVLAFFEDENEDGDEMYCEHQFLHTLSLSFIAFSYFDGGFSTICDLRAVWSISINVLAFGMARQRFVPSQKQKTPSKEGV